MREVTGIDHMATATGMVMATMVMVLGLEAASA